MNAGAVIQRGNACRYAVWATALVLSAGISFPASAEPIFHAISFNDGRLVLTWSSSPGNFYEVQSRPDVDRGNWSTVTSFVAGALITTWTDPKRRSASGFIGLQNYNDGKTVRHRNLRIKDLPSTTTPP